MNDNTDHPVTPAGNDVAHTHILEFKPRSGRNEDASSVESGDEQERFVFICGKCSCRTFSLYADGSIECAYCNEQLHENEGNAEQWRKVLPDAPASSDDTPVYDDANGVAIKQMPDENFARRRTMRDISKWDKDDELVLTGGYNKDGTGAWWFQIYTEEQRQWMMHKLRQILAHIEDAAQDLKHGVNTSTLSVAPKRPTPVVIPDEDTLPLFGPEVFSRNEDAGSVESGDN